MKINENHTLSSKQQTKLEGGGRLKKRAIQREIGKMPKKENNH